MKSQDWLLFQQLFRSQIEAVFRYQLICTGDWRVAEERTAEVFHTALAWFSPKLARYEPLIPWLWQISQDSQGRHDSQWIEPEGFRAIEIPQYQMLTFACAAQVTGEWKSLPRLVSEPLALFYFGRLEIHQVAVLTHLSIEQVKRMILQSGSDTLSDLSSDLHPVRLFSQELEQELEAQSPGKKPYRVSLQRRLRKQTARFPILGQGWISNLAILALIIGLSVAVWRSVSGSNDATEDSSSSPAAKADRLPSFTHSNYSIEDGYSAPTATADPFPSFSFGAIQDDLILVDLFGQIRLLPLASGTLSEAIKGFPYLPCTNPTHQATDLQNTSPKTPPGCSLNTIREPRYPAQLSPDGRWLAITRPIAKDSWILPLNGLGSALKISSLAVRFVWTPDGHAVAFVDQLDPGNLVLYDVVDKTQISFPRLEKGQWLSLAWSPDSKWLVAAYVRGDDDQRVYFTRIEPRKSKWEPLAETDLSPADRLGGFDLAFRADGKELLLPALGQGLLFDRENVAHLVQEPALPHTPESVLGNGVDHRYLSPDGKKIAMVETTSGSPKPCPCKPCPCTLHWYPVGPGQPWQSYTGWVDALAWTSDSSSLIIQSPSFSGPILIRIDARTGSSQKIADNLLLLGVRNPGQIEPAHLLKSP